MIVPNSSITDDSHDGMLVLNGENNSYRKKYFLILDRCEHLQKDNERLVHRIQQVRKLLKRSRKDRKLLMSRLDQYGDMWRTAPLPLPLDEEPSAAAVDLKPPATVVKTSPSPAEKGGRKSGSNSQAKKKPRVEKDPQAPKRPANPFFQFCQEQRPIVSEQAAIEGQEEISKQELTRMLATRWKTLSNESKKIYYDKYEKQKEKYAVDMRMYCSKGSGASMLSEVTP